MKDPTTFIEKMEALQERGVKEFESIISLSEELEKTIEEEHLEDYAVTKEDEEIIQEAQTKKEELHEKTDELRKKIEQTQYIKKLETENKRMRCENKALINIIGALHDAFEAACELYGAVKEKEKPENDFSLTK